MRYSFVQLIVEILVLVILLMITTSYVMTYNAGKENVKLIIRTVVLKQNVTEFVPTPVIVNVDGKESSCILINGKVTKGC